MHDLCGRPEQPEPPSAPTDMGSRREGEAVQHLQQELKKSEDDKQRGISGADCAAKAKNTPTLLLGKRHHCLYANLNGFEMEDKQKVSVNQFLFVSCIYCKLTIKRRRRALFLPVISGTAGLLAAFLGCYSSSGAMASLSQC